MTKIALRIRVCAAESAVKASNDLDFRSFFLEEMLQQLCSLNGKFLGLKSHLKSRGDDIVSRDYRRNDEGG